MPEPVQGAPAPKKKKVSPTPAPAQTPGNYQEFIAAVDGLKQMTANFSQAVEGLKTPKRVPGQPTPATVFSIRKGEDPLTSRHYSFTNVVKALRDGKWGKAKVERDAHNDLEAAGYRTSDGGFLVPSDPHSIATFAPQLAYMKELVRLPDDAVDSYYGPSGRKALAAFGSDVLGGALVNPVAANTIVELLRAQTVCIKAGAGELQLPQTGILNWARQTSDPTFYWVGENTAITPSDPSVGNIVFSAKTLAALVVMSNQSLNFSSPSIEIMVRQSLAAKGAIVQDAAFLEGSGGNFTPLGIKNISGITDYTSRTPAPGGIGTDGNTFQPEDAALMQALVEENNDNMGATAWIFRPMMCAALRNRRADAVTAGDKRGQFVNWISQSDPNSENGTRDLLNGLPALKTTSVSGTRSKGSSGSTLTYALTGNFRRMMIARSGVDEIAAQSTGSYFAANQTAIRYLSYLDMQVTHTLPFVVYDYLIMA